MSTVLQRPARVLANRRASERLWLLDLEVDDIPGALKPGQFVHARIPRMEGHILRRPFSVYQTSDDGRGLTILYQVVGFGSGHMTTLAPGEELDLMGPIGTGWSAPVGTRRALLVGGGAGAPALYLHAKELVSRGVEVEVALGAQTADALVCASDFAELIGHEPLLATDDGSRGRKGFCTVLVEEALAASPFDHVACCGPDPLMRAVAAQAKEAGVPAQVSLEKRMACGIGACLSCVVDTTEGRKRSCVDGPVFDASKVVWQ